MGMIHNHGHGIRTLTGSTLNPTRGSDTVAQGSWGEMKINGMIKNVRELKKLLCQQKCYMFAGWYFTFDDHRCNGQVQTVRCSSNMAERGKRICPGLNLGSMT